MWYDVVGWSGCIHFKRKNGGVCGSDVGPSVPGPATCRICGMSMTCLSTPWDTPTINTSVFLGESEPNSIYIYMGVLFENRWPKQLMVGLYFIPLGQPEIDPKCQNPHSTMFTTWWSSGTRHTSLPWQPMPLVSPNYRTGEGGPPGYKKFARFHSPNGHCFRKKKIHHPVSLGCFASQYLALLLYSDKKLDKIVLDPVPRLPGIAPRNGHQWDWMGEWSTVNPFVLILNILKHPQKPWFSRGVTHVWDLFISFLCKGVFNMTSGVGWIPWQRVDLIHLTLATVQDKDMMSRIARLIACGLSRDASCHGTVNRGLVANKEVLRPFWILFLVGEENVIEKLII